MATKKECDRCGKQWSPVADRYDRDAGDAELATLYISIPYQSSRTDRLKVDQSYELCQNCARHIHGVVKEKPAATPTIAGAQHRHLSPTDRIQREIMGDPNE